MQTFVMMLKPISFSRNRAASHDGVRLRSVFLRVMAILGLGMILAPHVKSAVAIGSEPKDWPANPAKHVINIRRDADDAARKRMIAAAEAAIPDQQALRRAAGDAPLPGDGVQWWYQEQLGIRIPFAITREAVDYYEKLIEGYQKQAFTRYAEPSSRLDYHATVVFHEECEHQGQKLKNVHVVTLKLGFSEIFAATATEGMSFEKQRVVILDAEGKVLYIAGDGTTEVPVMAI